MDITLVTSLVVFAALTALGLALVARAKGRKGPFGAPIQATVGEITDSRNPKLVSMKIHVLGEPPDKAVGLEIAIKTPGLGVALQVFPIVLSANDAKKLAEHLQVAHARKTYN